MYLCIYIYLYIYTCIYIHINIYAHKHVDIKYIYFKRRYIQIYVQIIFSESISSYLPQDPVPGTFMEVCIYILNI
jgi:hypothetical protein